MRPIRDTISPERTEIRATKIAFLRSVATDTPLASLSSSFEETKGALHISLHSDLPAVEGRFWTAASENQDFRDARWNVCPLNTDPGGRRLTGEVPRPASGWIAVIGEVHYAVQGRPYTLSTQIRILGSTL